MEDLGSRGTATSNAVGPADFDVERPRFCRRRTVRRRLPNYYTSGRLLRWASTRFGAVRTGCISSVRYAKAICLQERICHNGAGNR